MDANIAHIERRLARAARVVRERNVERDEAIRALARHGVTQKRISEIAGLTKGRVSQVVKRAREGNNSNRNVDREFLK